MRCCMCNRPLAKPTATIASRRGPQNFGPLCAKRAGFSLASTRRTRSRIVDAAQVERDPRQIDLFGVAHV